MKNKSPGQYLRWMKKKYLTSLTVITMYYSQLPSLTPTPPPNTSPNIIHLGPQHTHSLFRLWELHCLSWVRKMTEGNCKRDCLLEEALARVLGQSCKKWLKSWATTPGTTLSLVCVVSHLSGVKVKPSANSRPTKNWLPPGRTYSPFPVSHLRQWFKVLKGREMIHAN